MKAGSNDAGAGPPLSQRLLMLRRMIEIRLFEDECHRLFAAGEVRGTTHLCQGQEATVVGACDALNADDTMTCTYRGHGAVLAKGAPLDRAFGEILGKRDGLCRGKGGSMHLTDTSVGAMGSFAIVGCHLPIALGLAFAARYMRRPEVSLCFFGDGSTNIGSFHESLNMAAVWRLPVIFLLENNLYGEYSSLASTTPIGRLSDRASSYGLPGVTIDGNDVLVVRKTVMDAAARARRGEGPTLIEAMTYRHKGHSRSDPATYRPAGELEEWLRRDPIATLERALMADGLSEGDLARVREEARREVGAALERARSWPAPDEAEITEDVYA
jgi:acetoin:2,6-dichlorophenolindophenol oxidoreductase subunit alpha